jgi:hypothetical protein
MPIDESRALALAEGDRQRVPDGMRRLPPAYSYACPSCSHKLDIQGIERGSRIVFDLWCHGCGAHITMRLKP